MAKYQLEPEIADHQTVYESEARLAGILAAATDAIISVNAAQRIVLVNPAAEKMFGWATGEIQGEPLDRLIPPRFRRRHQYHIRDFGETGVTTRAMGKPGAISGQRKDGSEFPVEASISQIVVAGQKLYTVILRDITQSKKAETALVQSEQRFRALVENSFDAIALFGKDGAILYGSPSTPQILGYALDEFVGRNAFDLIHPDDQVQVRSRLTESIQKPGRGVGFLARVRHKDGAWCWLEGVFTNLLAAPSVQAIVNNYHDVTERKGVEEQLRYQANLIQNVSDAILSTDVHYVIESWNKAAETIYGWSAEEVLGRPAADIFQTEYLMSRREEVIATLLERGHWQGEVIQKRKDGTPIYILASSSLLEDGHRNRIGIVSVNRDITARKQAEAAQARMAAIVESSDDAVISKSLVGIIQSWNRGAVRLYGYTAAEAIGRPINMLAPPDWPDEIPQILEQIQQGTPLNHLETVRMRKDGTRLDVSITVSPIRDPTGAITGAATIARDITERKREENRQHFLAQASDVLVSSLAYETTLATIAQLAVPRVADWCAIHLVKADGTFDPVALAHVDPAKVAWARDLQRRFPPNPNASHGIPQVMRSGQAEFIADIPDEVQRMQIQDPEILQILAELDLGSGMTVPLTVRGRILGAVSFFSTQARPPYSSADLALAEELARRAAVAVDNARLYRAAQRLNEELEQRVLERTAQLEAANTELEAFSYSVSHDLRAPLGHIGGFVELLQKNAAPTLDEANQRYLNIIAESADRMGTLIDDLLAFSRVGRTELKTTLVAMGQLVQEVIDSFEQDTRERQITWHIASLPRAQADSALLRLVWSNLIANALKYTRPRPQAEITIGFQPGAGETIFFIHDNGVGFDMRYVNKLFGVFQRLHSAATFEGTGIGLANVRRIITRHGGRTWAEGVVDGGATFYFSLPHSKEAHHDGRIEAYSAGGG